MAYSYYLKSLSEVRQKIIDNIHETIPEADTSEGKFLSNFFINPLSDEVTAIYGDMELLKNNQSIIFATGDNLDLLAANYFITRKQASKSTGKVRFYITGSNKPASEIKDTDIPEVIAIPLGTKLSTDASFYNDSVSVITTELAYYTRDIIKTLPIDGETGYRYIECAAESSLTGTAQNIAAGEIVNLDSSIQGIISVTNPFAFSGATDREDDISLTYRIQLAITGNNIGTKDGYLKYVLDQDNVVAAKVAGAGDEIMFRDGGYIKSNGEYQWGAGGCVDIYIRGHQILNDSYAFTINANYLRNPYNIILYNQPVVNIISIKSELTGETLVDAAHFDTEQYSYVNGESTIIDTMYCTDILWDFSLTDSFPDIDYYSLPVGYTTAQIERLKLAVDADLLDALEYMSNISYSIDWSNASTRTTSGSSTELFDKVYVNDAVYKLVAKEDSNLDGRVFIMKNNQIYVRAYVEPDYILQKDTDNYAGGMTGEDSIKWLNTSKLLQNDVLTINYNYDYLIHELQLGIDEQKCLTADVLVKQAVEVPVEIIADIEVFNTARVESIKNDIASNISTYINTQYPLGGSIDTSDLISIIKTSQYVDKVDITTFSLSRKGQLPEQRITIKDNEYFVLDSLVLNATLNNSILA